MMVETRQGSFAAQIKAFADQTKQNMDGIVRNITLELGTRLVIRSPVGNPELWAINRFAKSHIERVAAYNAALRSNKNNVDKLGRLKRGLAISLPSKPERIAANLDKAGRFKRGLQNGVIRAPKGYVGGHFRANWQFGTSIPTGEVDGVDPEGTATIGSMTADISATGAGGVTYLVNNAPYAIPLEYGHSTQAPQGIVRVTIAEFNQVVEQAVQEVKS